MTPPERSERRAWLVASIVIALAYSPLASELYWFTWNSSPDRWRDAVGQHNWYGAAELVFSLLLALSTPCASGLGLGTPSHNGKALAALMIAPPLIAAIVIPQLPERPFSGQGISTWLLSPIAQELVFFGFVFGRLQPSFPEPIAARLRVSWGIVFTALCFSLSHVWGFESAKITASYVGFQLAYTFVGGLVHGLIRQLSGSVWYGVLVHMAVNWIAARP
jgi:membrane protease YdiL (CAAX protease family)